MSGSCGAGASSSETPGPAALLSRPPERAGGPGRGFICTAGPASTGQAVSSQGQWRP